MLRLNNVSKIYGKDNNKVVALNEATILIEEGKFYSIIGKSGSGKTTLLNILGAIDNPTNGDVYFYDKKINDLSNTELAEYRNKNIGYIFQSFYLENSYTVLDNVCMPQVIMGVSKKVRINKAKEILSELNLEDKINKKPHELSGGEKQRVAIARALINNPSIILADEPTGNLDTNNSKLILDILRKIADEGKTVVLVTHNLDDAKKYADIIYEITDGVVKQC